MKKSFLIFTPSVLHITQIVFAQKAVEADRRLGTWVHENKISNGIVKSMPLYEDGTLLFGGATRSQIQ